MGVMLIILNYLADKIYMEEQNEVSSHGTVHESNPLSELYESESSSEDSFNSELLPEDRS